MEARRDVAKAKQALDTLYEISNILGTGLDKETLSILVALCETGARAGRSGGARSLRRRRVLRRRCRRSVLPRLSPWGRGRPAAAAAAGAAADSAGRRRRHNRAPRCRGRAAAAGRATPLRRPPRCSNSPAPPPAPLPAGVNPEALAAVVREIRREAAAIASEAKAGGAKRA